MYCEGRSVSSREAFRAGAVGGLLGQLFYLCTSSETNLRFLRAGGQIEWLIIMTVVHGLRAALQSMLTARARLPLPNLGAAVLACASRQAQAAIIITCARPHVDHRRTWLARTESRPV